MVNSPVKNLANPKKFYKKSFKAKGIKDQKVTVVPTNPYTSQKRPLTPLKRYFRNSLYPLPDVITSLVESLTKLFENPEFEINHIADQIIERRVFYFDLSKLDDDDSIITLDFFTTCLHAHPSLTLLACSVAVHQHILANKDFLNLKHIDEDLNIITRLLSYSRQTSICNLKSNLLGKFVAVRGTVSLVDKVKVLPMSMTFLCDRCNTQQTHYFKDESFSNPVKCASDECISKTFTPLFKNIQGKEYQSVTIHEIVENENAKHDKMPASINVILEFDLVGSCSPGEDLLISGILKGQNSEEANSKSRVFFSMFIEANFICNASNRKLNQTQMYSREKWTEFEADDDQPCIDDLKRVPNLFELLVSSFCPSIYGHCLVKAALLLCLVSGTASIENTFRRSNAHTLLIGDPGLGKSQLLKAVCGVAPKSVYICGSSSSSAGITVSLSKESGSNEFMIEPGAIVLANKGVCCIDEFDKIPQHHESLLEVMEQQCVSIAKSGTRCNMQAQTSIIAAANFNQGSYKNKKTFIQNVNISNNLLSRFDMIFVLLDQKNKNFDLKLADHVLKLRMCKKRALSPTSHEYANSNLENSLQEFAKSMNNHLPLSTIKFLISYAKQQCHPKLSSEAIKCIKDYYLSLRAKQSQNSVPVTVRHCESLMRLTIARARIELRDVVTKRDAEDVIDIFKKSMSDMDVILNPDNKLSKEQSLKKPSLKTQVSDYVAKLKLGSVTKQDKLFSVDELKEISQQTVTLMEFNTLLDKLNNDGVLLKKGGNLYQLTC